MKYRDEIALQKLRDSAEPDTGRSQLRVEDLATILKCSYRNTLRILCNLESLGEIRRARTRPKHTEIYVKPVEAEAICGSSAD